MSRIEKVDASLLKIKTEMGTIEVQTPLSDQNYLFIKTDLGSIEIRMNVLDEVGLAESIMITPDKDVKIIGDTMVVLRR